MEGPSDLQPPTDDEVFFENYIPPARDAIHMPIHVLYMVLATIIIIMTLYAIIGHLIKDLLHDLADWLFGKQPEEVEINFLEARDKFMVDWCPETTPELEELARAEQIKVVLESSNQTPAIWVISDGSETRPPRAGPHYLTDDAEKAPPLQAHTLREFEQHLNDLKKENFSLKLRIYFLEERIQQKYENNTDDVYRTNIELKVEVESLKQELQEKQQLLDKALTTAESLTNNNEAELQRRCEARQQEIDHMQQVLHSRIQLLQEEAQFARSEAERMASLAESCSQHSAVTMEPITKEMSVAKSCQPPNLLPENRDNKRIEELTAAVLHKEMLIRELTEERSSLRDRVTEMEEQLQELSASLLQKERDAEELHRDGRGEFVCSKCAFMLERMYRFDTVVARVEALSIERLHKLLLEKERLRQCIRGMYHKHNNAASKGKGCMVDMSGLHDAKYCALVEEDLMYSMYESWAEDEAQTLECGHNPQCHGSDLSALWHRLRRCRGCSMLRVADPDYEAVCKVPRKLARSTSCGPSTRYSEATMTTTASTTLVPESRQTTRASSDSDKTLEGRSSSSNSADSLNSIQGAVPPVEDQERDGREEQIWEQHLDPKLDHASTASKMQLALCLVQNCIYKPVQIPSGSRLPVLIKAGCLDTGFKQGNRAQALRTPTDGAACKNCPPKISGLELMLAELEEMWNDLYVEYLPFCLKKVTKKSLIEEQQSQLNQYESAAGQCVSELQKAQQQVQSLQNKIQDSESSNQKLQDKLGEMETELRSIRQAAQNQDRTIQSLTESLNTKDTETQELYQVIEGQNTTLCNLREMTHRSQLQHSQIAEGVDLQSEVVALQSSLFSCQLELEATQRAQRQSRRVAEDLTLSRDRLQNDLQVELQQRETTEKYNQDLRSTMQQLRSELQVKDAQLKESEADKQAEILAQEKIISELKFALQEKETIVQEYSELLDQPAESDQSRDAMLNKLKSRIRDRDRALERAIDEKFSCLEEKETEVRKLQLALREKERDLERLRCILTNNEETITSLDGLMRSKELELEQTRESFRKLQWLKQQSDEKHAVVLRERDDIIAQLHTTLHARSKETEDLTAALLAKLSPIPNEVVDELKSRLALKDRLFQDLLSERSRQTQEHHTLIQDLLETISSRDQYIKESGKRLGQMITERTGQLHEMRRQLSSREQELSGVKRDKEREREKSTRLAMDMERLQSILREKEVLIQRELSELKSALTKKPENHICTDPQAALEQLVSEYQQLNQALRAEKKIYQNLNHMQSTGDSVETTQALHLELDTAQALRGQLEEVLRRIQATALALERAAKAHADYGEFSTDEDEDEIDDDGDEDEGSSSEEFTDSIEEDVRLNAESLASTEYRLFCLTAAPTNIYIQGLDTVTQLSNEIRVLKEENLNLHSRLQGSRDNNEEVEQLREAVLSGRARLKQAELEAEQWKEELRRLQTHSCEQSQQIQKLRQDRQSNQGHNNRLQHEVSLLQQQLSESRQLLQSLQCELQLYDRVIVGRKSTSAGYFSELPYSTSPAVGELNHLLVEVRALRAQLERSVQENSALRIQLQKQLEQQLNTASLEPRPVSLMPASPLRDTLYRRQLLHDPSPSPPVRDVGPFPSGPPCSPYSELEESSLTANDSLEPHADLEGDAPDGSFANRNGRHAIGHVDDFNALQQQVIEGRGLVHRMEATLNTCLNTALMEVNTGKALDYATVKTLLSNTKTLRQILEEAMSLLKMFWRAALPSTDSPAQYLQKEQSMKEEIQSLRLRIAEQEEVLQNTVQRLRSTSRTKESMETFIVSQRQVLKDVYPGPSDRGCVTPAIPMETSCPRFAKKRARECLH
ncbi:Myomegalin [Bagarius yarrelli]|uniref:Myomegalin n=1 Tax=Bagarius yarrelli TaxID=175774 RepID=A0A556UZ89_BAGYA|nr:Myomegalin [Bagarius yarrelli]